MSYLYPDDDRELYREYLNRRPTPAEPARMKYGPTYQWEESQMSDAWLEWARIDTSTSEFIRRRGALHLLAESGSGDVREVANG
ncbi:MAG TPA: hypothetical protein VFB19_18450 [Mycobacterium sp.]|nr:hypothetical protein [Mycobacterium sp.]